MARRGYPRPARPPPLVDERRAAAGVEIARAHAAEQLRDAELPQVKGDEHQRDEPRDPLQQVEPIAR